VFSIQAFADVRRAPPKSQRYSGGHYGDEYIQEFNGRFAVAAAQSGHAFLPVRGKNLDLIFSLQHERTVHQDNTVRIGPCILQIEKTPWHATLAGCRVTVYQHLDRTWSVA
jgi:hypothetical protein